MRALSRKSRPRYSTVGAGHVKSASLAHHFRGHELTVAVQDLGEGGAVLLDRRLLSGGGKRWIQRKENAPWAKLDAAIARQKRQMTGEADNLWSWLCVRRLRSCSWPG
jgi:hypothetical protein